MKDKLSLAAVVLLAVTACAQDTHSLLDEAAKEYKLSGNYYLEGNVNQSLIHASRSLDLYLAAGYNGEADAVKEFIDSTPKDIGLRHKNILKNYETAKDAYVNADYDLCKVHSKMVVEYKGDLVYKDIIQETERMYAACSKEVKKPVFDMQENIRLARHHYLLAKRHYSGKNMTDASINVMKAKALYETTGDEQGIKDSNKLIKSIKFKYDSISHGYILDALSKKKQKRYLECTRHAQNAIVNINGSKDEKYVTQAEDLIKECKLEQMMVEVNRQQQTKSKDETPEKEDPKPKGALKPLEKSQGPTLDSYSLKIAATLVVLMVIAIFSFRKRLCLDKKTCY